MKYVIDFLLKIFDPFNEFLGVIYKGMIAFFQDIKLDDTLAFFCKYHLLICSLIFVIMLIYFCVYDKSKSYSSFKEPWNIIIVLAFIPVYMFFSERNLDFSIVGLGSIPIHSFILIVIAKLYGPLMTAAFGGLEYILSYIANPNSPLMISLFFVYAIGGMIHGWILYEKKTAFWRCLVARVLAVVLCNALLISFVRAGVYGDPISTTIPATLTTNIIQVPIQTVIGYISLLILRFIRKKLEF